MGKINAGSDPISKETSWRTKIIIMHFIDFNYEFVT